MTEIRVFCDRCGAQIHRDCTRIKAERGFLILRGQPQPRIDLCRPCEQDLRSFFAGPVDAIGSLVRPPAKPSPATTPVA